jgi:hypothetical protein
LNVLSYSIVLGLGGRHPIEKVGERWFGGRVSSVEPHVEGVVGFSDTGLTGIFLVAWDQFMKCSILK